jgi:hypothetical protein
MLGLVATMVFLCQCSVHQVQMGPSLPASARWVLLPFENYAEAPKAGERVETFVKEQFGRSLSEAGVEIGSRGLTAADTPEEILEYMLGVGMTPDLEDTHHIGAVELKPRSSDVARAVLGPGAREAQLVKVVAGRDEEETHKVPVPSSPDVEETQQVERPKILDVEETEQMEVTR